MSRLSRGDRPRRRLQQSRPDDAPSRRSGRSRSAQVDRDRRAGIRAYPMCTPNRITDYFKMRNTQMFRGLPTWHPILLSSRRGEAARLCRSRGAQEAARRGGRVQCDGPPIGICATWWDYIWSCRTPCCEKNKWMEGKTIGEIAKAQGKGIIDAFLDLSSRRSSTPSCCRPRTTSTTRRCAQILTYPNAVIGLSDGGAHVQFHERLRLLDPAASANGCARSRS